MISIICCSITPELSTELRQNISTTIGKVNWEWLCIDNRDSENGICKVYNEAASKAKGDILCFVHEDVVFHMPGWGQALKQVFSQIENPGIIGVAGSRLIVSPQAGWYNFTKSNLNRYNIIQNYRNKTKEKLYINPQKEENSKVLLVDGVFMCMKKEVWKVIPFNEQLLDGFHFYDVDISLRVASKFNNYVNYSFEMEHLSEGSINKDWVQSFLLFDKGSKVKTRCLDRMSTSDIINERKFKLVHLITNLVKFDYPFCVVLKYIIYNTPQKSDH